MRDLTKKQKRLLEEFLNENKDVSTVGELIETDVEFYEQLEKIHDTEILYQNINNFIHEKRMAEIDI